MAEFDVQFRVPATGNVEAKMWRMQKEHEEEADKWAREKRYIEQQHAHSLALHKQEAHEHGLAMQEVCVTRAVLREHDRVCFSGKEVATRGRHEG